jgi:hypothetical protein
MHVWGGGCSFNGNWFQQLCAYPGFHSFRRGSRLNNGMIGLILANKPVLVGLHLVFAIIGIDAMLWLLGEIIGRSNHRKRIFASALIGLAGFILSWIVGGYYYVRYYGAIVKPIILAGSAPWAHKIAMEAKEHIFLFIIPLVVTILFAALMDQKTLDETGIRKPLVYLIACVVIIALGLGLMGFIISAAARWA